MALTKKQVGREKVQRGEIDYSAFIFPSYHSCREKKEKKFTRKKKKVKLYLHEFIGAPRFSAVSPTSCAEEQQSETQNIDLMRYLIS